MTIPENASDGTGETVTVSELAILVGQHTHTVAKHRRSRRGTAGK